MLGEIEWLYSRIVDRCPAMPTSEMGQSRRFDQTLVTSGLAPMNGHLQGRSACLKRAMSGRGPVLLERRDASAPHCAARHLCSSMSAEGDHRSPGHAKHTGGPSG